MPDEKEPWADSAEYWKNVLFGVSLTFGIIPTLAYALRVCASIKVSRKVRADDIFMGFAVLFMWGTTAAVCMSTLGVFSFLYLIPDGLTDSCGRGFQWYRYP